MRRGPAAGLYSLAYIASSGSCPPHSEPPASLQTVPSVIVSGPRWPVFVPHRSHCLPYPALYPNPSPAQSPAPCALCYRCSLPRSPARP
ncbi:hypothetical protein C8Q73DRAFT_417856 [Cubamyces lactineus]|nr:hypothetical protein C8Q73DRAFT_417856 [Cubamyces lactineus]